MALVVSGDRTPARGSKRRPVGLQGPFCCLCHTEQRSPREAANVTRRVRVPESVNQSRNGSPLTGLGSDPPRPGPRLPPRVVGLCRVSETRPGDCSAHPARCATLRSLSRKHESPTSRGDIGPVHQLRKRCANLVPGSPIATKFATASALRREIPRFQRLCAPCLAGWTQVVLSYGANAVKQRYRVRR